MLMGMILCFFLFSIKTSTCSGSCNNINNRCAKLCVPHVVKNLKLKVFNPVTGTNETRRIEWHETCKCKCIFSSSVCNNKQSWNDDKCRCECKELIDKGARDKGLIWNPSNCECECYKLVERSSTEECTENIEETRLVEITSAKNENEHKCSSCTLYIVLYSIFFTINVGIGSYFLYFHWYLKKDVICVKFGTRTQTTI